MNQFLMNPQECWTNNSRCLFCTKKATTCAKLVHGNLTCDEQDSSVRAEIDSFLIVCGTSILETYLKVPGCTIIADSGIIGASVCAPAENRTVSASFQSRQEDARRRLGRAGRTEPVPFYIPFGTSSELDHPEEVRVSDFRARDAITLLQAVQRAQINLLDLPVECFRYTDHCRRSRDRIALADHCISVQNMLVVVVNVAAECMLSRHVPWFTSLLLAIL